jgi:hypothetical protein
MPLPLPQALPRRPLHRDPWLSLPRRPDGRRNGMPPARRGKRRSPAFLAVPGELEVVALARHADHDAADAEPAAEERARLRQRAGRFRPMPGMLRREGGGFNRQLLYLLFPATVCAAASCRESAGLLHRSGPGWIDPDFRGGPASSVAPAPRSARRAGLPLDGSHAPALDQEALDDQEEEDGGNGDHHRARHEEAPVHYRRLVHVLEADGHRQEVALV